MRRNRAFLAVLLAVVLLDQAAKAAVVATMRLGESIRLVDGLLSLTYVRNTGIAFGLLNDGRGGLKVVLLGAGTLLALGFLVWLLRDLDPGDAWGGAAVGLVAGGALGNLIDRVRLGEVVDFVDAYWRGWHWPAFNVADSAITVGVVLLVAHQAFGWGARPRETA